MVSEDDITNAGKGIIVVIGVAVLVIVAIFIFATLADASPVPLQNANETFLVQSQQTLDQTPISLTSQRLNTTWLDFDGINDVVTISSTDQVITFWYKNLTSDWIFVVNNSGVTYVDGSLATPVQFPVFFDLTDYFIGKTDGSTFFAGSIDEIRIYDTILTTEDIVFLFNLGR